MQLDHEMSARRPNLSDTLFFLGFACFLLGGWIFYLYVQWPPSALFLIITLIALCAGLFAIFGRSADFDAVTWKKRTHLSSLSSFEITLQKLIPYGAVIGMVVVLLIRSIAGDRVRDLIGITIYPGIMCVWSVIEHCIYYLNNQKEGDN